MVLNGSVVNVSGVNAPPKLVNGGTVVGFKEYGAVATRLVSGVNRFTLITDSKEITVLSQLVGGASGFAVSTNGVLDVTSNLTGASSFTVDSDGALTVNAVLGATMSQFTMESLGKVNSVTFSDVVGDSAYVVEPVNIAFQVEQS